MECVKAAMSIVTIVNDLFDGSQLFRAFWVCLMFDVKIVTLIWGNIVYTILRVLCYRRSLRIYNPMPC